jgi:glycosyltransferase involved in cell wall biosynthesis
VRVGLDLTYCFGRMGGIHRYAIEIAKALSSDPGPHDYLIFVRRAPPAELLDTGLDFVVCTELGHFAAEQAWLPWVARRYGVDLMHLTGFPGPLVFGGPTVSTVFDATAFLFPATMQLHNRMYWRHIQPRTAQRSQVVITTSNNAAGDIARYHRVSRNRIHVIPLAVATELSQLVGRTGTIAMEAWSLPERFILGVSTFEPRKNFGRLVEAYRQLVSTRGGRDYPHLVIAGSPGWIYQDVFRLVAESGLADLIHFTPKSPSTEQLAELYSKAVCLAFPSLYEGFGLPPIEAMAFGCPVLTSNVASLPEVVGDAALLVDPLDVNAIARGLEQLTSDDALRSDLIRRGRKRAQFFSWARAARQTRAVYDHALEMSANHEIDGKTA